MASALAMILAAGMTIPGDVPKEAMEEVGPAPLCLDGEWQGTITYDDKKTQEVSLAGSLLVMWLWSRVAIFSWEVKDEGWGRFRVTYDGVDRLGIYEWRGEEVALCIQQAGKGRPSSFKPVDGQELLILHRVKPRK